MGPVVVMDGMGNRKSLPPPENETSIPRYFLQFRSELFFYQQYLGLLIKFWLFLFAAQPKAFLLDGLKKLEQRSRKCVEIHLLENITL
jgi:hypothetical protein